MFTLCDTNIAFIAYFIEFYSCVSYHLMEGQHDESNILLKIQQKLLVSVAIA